MEIRKVVFGVAICLVSCGAAQAPNKNLIQTAKHLQHKHFKKIKNKNKLVIIDYSLPVFKKRLWVINPKTNKILFHSRVGHAGWSGIVYATDFSNVPGSNKSSIGSFITLSTHHGKFGYSLNVKGLDRGINNNAYRRRIIFHKMNNKPWSLGCFTIPQKEAKNLINMIKGGVFVYVSY